jgi:hypothetical protein
MPITPDPRSEIRPLRGTLEALTANIIDIGDFEICFATDTQQLYTKQGGALVAIGANLGAATLDNLGDVSFTGVTDGDALIYNNGLWRNGGQQDGGNF